MNYLRWVTPPFFVSVKRLFEGWMGCHPRHPAINEKQIIGRKTLKTPGDMGDAGDAGDMGDAGDAMKKTKKTKKIRVP